MRSIARSTACSVLLVLPDRTSGVFLSRQRSEKVAESSQVGQRHLSSGRVVEEGPHPASWYGDFSEQESTYTSEGLVVDRARNYLYGKDPGSFPPMYESLVKQPWAVYTESLSAGPQDAFQTFWPAVRGGLVGSSRKDDTSSLWRETPQGWVEDYKYPFFSGSAHKSAEWFDSSVLQYDGFGRLRPPTVGLTAGAGGLCTASEGWEERSINATLTCSTPGCNASTTLQLFDPATEETCGCRMSLTLHPTDYENNIGEEIVEYIKVNGKVAGQCNPRNTGCNATASTPLYPCLADLDVSQMVSSTGQLLIEGKNSWLVDECPYNGDLLSAFVAATFLVRTRTNASSSDSPFGSPLGSPLGNGNNSTEGNDDPNNTSNLLNNCSSMSPQEQEATIVRFLFSWVPKPAAPKTPLEGLISDPKASQCSLLATGHPTQSPGPLGGLLGGLLGGPLGDLLRRLLGGPAGGPPGSAGGPPGGPLGAPPPGMLTLDPPLPGTQLALQGDLAKLVATSGTVPLKCAAERCIATQRIMVNGLMALLARNGAKCGVSVAFNHTDFDDSYTQPEIIQFVNLSGVALATDLPGSIGVKGLNPCFSNNAGTPLAPADMTFLGVKDQDITQVITTTTFLDLASSISGSVDECPSNGYLLDGAARVDCFAP